MKKQLWHSLSALLLPIALLLSPTHGSGQATAKTASKASQSPQKANSGSGQTPTNTKDKAVFMRRMTTLSESYFIKPDGSLWMFGNIFKQVGSDNDWAAVSQRRLTTMALKTDGSLWAWGLNGYGQLGDGTTTDSSTPVQIGEEKGWKVVSASMGQYGPTVAIRTDGSLWAWGRNDYGELGIGTRGEDTSKKAPVQVGTDKDWAAVSVGYYHSMALKTNGSLWGWGNNRTGALGDGTTANRIAPAQIGAAKNWAAVCAGLDRTVAIMTDGSLWEWGLDVFSDDISGNSKDNRNTPVQVGTEKNWAAVTACSYHTVALKTDGSLWAWGRNDRGELGDYTTTKRYTPIRVGEKGSAENPNLNPKSDTKQNLATRNIKQMLEVMTARVSFQRVTVFYWPKFTTQQQAYQFAYHCSQHVPEDTSTSSYGLHFNGIQYEVFINVGSYMEKNLKFRDTYVRIANLFSSWLNNATVCITLYDDNYRGSDPIYSDPKYGIAGGGAK